MAVEQAFLPYPEEGLELAEKQEEEPEVISLTLPHEDRFLNVARIVVGGLAARLQLSYETLDDLQLAVESVLGNERYRTADLVTIEISIIGPEVSILVGPLDVERVMQDLERTSEEAELTLQVLLAAVVDSIAMERRGGADWVRLDKRVPLAAAG
jgi:hypothetical protein